MIPLLANQDLTPMLRYLVVEGSKISLISNTGSAVALLIIIFFSYIVRERIVQGDTSTYQYKLGLRSQTETSKRRILEFISEVFYLYLICESFL